MITNFFDWVPLGLSIIFSVVWLVRLEGRINVLDTKVDQLKQLRDDLGRIEGKLDGLILVFVKAKPPRP